jgi:hypothetical protein
MNCYKTKVENIFVLHIKRNFRQVFKLKIKTNLNDMKLKTKEDNE